MRRTPFFSPRILWCTPATHRDARSEALDPAGLAPARVHLRMDEAGTYRVDADAFTGDLASEANGEGIDGALGRRVVHVLAR